MSTVQDKYPKLVIPSGGVLITEQSITWGIGEFSVHAIHLARELAAELRNPSTIYQQELELPE